MNLLFHYPKKWLSVQAILMLLGAVGCLWFGAGVAQASAPIQAPQQETDGQTIGDPSQIAYTVPDSMNVRSGPGLAFSVVTTVAAGTPIEIIDQNEDGDWVQTRLANRDETVWLARWLLRFDSTSLPGDGVAAVVVIDSSDSEDGEGSTTADAATVADGVIAVTQPGRMNVRSGPGTDYAVVTTAAAGTQSRVLALAAADQWLQVELSGQSEPVWIFRSLTTVRGSLAELPRLSDSEIPPRPQAAAQARAVAPTASTLVNAPLPSGGGSFGYGIQSHMIHTGQQGTVMDKTREMGFTWVKQQIEWRIFESNQGQIGFGDVGPIVGAANERGLNLLFSVVNAPDWAREAGFDANVGGPPADPQTYANFVGALAREYCGTSLKAIEVWNEQNLHYEWGNKALNAADYMALLRPAYASIKAACPSMLVISGAPTPAGDNGNFAVDDLRYLEQMFQNGLTQYADGIGAHPSGYNVPPSVTWDAACAAIQQSGNSFNGACDNPHHSWSFRSTMEGYRNLAVIYGASHLRIWPTEFGWAAGGAFDPRYAYANDNSFDEQARWTVEAYQMMKNWGWVGPAFLWNLNFRVVANGSEKAQWGIVNNDWTPLPTFYALRDMAK